MSEQQTFLIEKWINGDMYWLDFHGLGYVWLSDPKQATKFSTIETANEFLNSMSEEGCRITDVEWWGTV